MLTRAFLIPVILVGVQSIPFTLQAQWLNYPARGSPRTRDGKVNVNAAPPRTREKKPDLSGVWHPEITPVEDWRRRFGDAIVDQRLNSTSIGMGIGTVSIYSSDVFYDLKLGDNPMRLETKLRQRQTDGDPCQPFGFPWAILLTPVHKIIQTPTEILMMLEEGNFTRQIYTDGRPLPKDPQPSWFGYSTGKWKGDTLVVETNGLNDLTPLDGLGHPRSESTRITERYRRRDFGHMEVEVTFEDPTLYRHPFSIHFMDLLLPDSDMLENFCSENERDIPHMQPEKRSF